MSAAPATEYFPRAPLMGVLAFIAVTLVAVATSRLLGFDTANGPDVPVAASRDLRFLDRSDGGVDVIDAALGQRIDVLEPGTNGFIRGVMRSFVRDRRTGEASREPPFRLAKLADGRLVLDDLATGKRVQLAAFGPTNASAFARFLTAEEVRR